MQHSQYRFKFYFNASHSIYLSGEMGQNHPHTWEVILNVMKISDNFVMFTEVEKMCEGFLSEYQDVVINAIPPFTTINPTLENICIYFKDQLQKMLHEKGWLLLTIELSETPSRSYVIGVSDEMEERKYLFDLKTEETLQGIVERMVKGKVDTLKNFRRTGGLTKEEEAMLKDVERKLQKQKRSSGAMNIKEGERKGVLRFFSGGNKQKRNH